MLDNVRRMSDTILASDIVDNAASPQSMTVDGVTIVSQNLAGQIAAKKYLDANANVSAIAAGTHYFGQVMLIPPGAGGRNAILDY